MYKRNSRTDLHVKCDLALGACVILCFEFSHRRLKTRLNNSRSGNTSWKGGKMSVSLFVTVAVILQGLFNYFMN